jgi:thioredoxin reductase (NADPH)
MTESPIDCVIVGGGPAGLVAALYLARYRRRVRVVDAGHSRAAWIPISLNMPGFPDGVNGWHLLQLMRTHARMHGADISEGTVTDIRKDRTFHIGLTDGSILTARTVLLATGVEDVIPSDWDIAGAVTNKVVRLCPVCDAFEATGLNVAVVGVGARGVEKARFLRRYTDRVTLYAQSPISEHDRDWLMGSGTNFLDASGLEIQFSNTEAIIRVSGQSASFDVVYPAFGSTIRSELARIAGAKCNKDECIIVDKHQETSVSELFAAGDVVEALDQISVASGHATIAAARINTVLSAHDGGK